MSTRSSASPARVLSQERNEGAPPSTSSATFPTTKSSVADDGTASPSVVNVKGAPHAVGEGGSTVVGTALIVDGGERMLSPKGRGSSLPCLAWRQDSGRESE